jgi:hypothetical protein
MNRTILWIARDKEKNDGEPNLFLFTEKPVKRGDYFYNEGNFYTDIPNKMFPEVTFENSPMKLTLTIENNEQ